jgi:hypothetical protein
MEIQRRIIWKNQCYIKYYKIIFQIQGFCFTQNMILASMVDI